MSHSVPSSLPKRDKVKVSPGKQSATPPLSRYLRFSLRTFFLLIIATGVWLSVISNRARVQKQSVDRVNQLGGQVGFDYQFDDKMAWRKDAKLPAPVWMIDLIGPDYARSITIVNFDEGSDPSDEDLKVIASCTSLKQLSLANRKRITDNGLRHFTRLTELEVLALNGTNVAGEGLQHTQNMQKLKGLTLDNSPLTDEALIYIGRLEKLEWLLLSNTRVTDDGLRHLATLKSLENLQLRGTSLTDEAVKYLSGLTSLKRVLLGENVSEEGRALLQAQLPKCKISN